MEWTRRDILRSLSAGSLGISLTGIDLSRFEYVPSSLGFSDRTLSRKITAITCGAGNRGNVYGNYAANFPEELDIIGVAEPIELRRQRYADKHQITLENQFLTWEDIFKRPKFADFIIVTTPDNLHYGPAMAALEMGYNLLLEKPIAQTWKECNDILQLQKKKKAIVAVCHVLRYAPYYRKIKEVLQSGVLGELVSIQHFEPVEREHMAHSFVRGNWRRSEDTNPIILAKSCHDLDMLRWWIDKKCTHISSFGNLKWFKSSNAPEGSTARCTDGCAIEGSCPYSALKIYHRGRRYTYAMDLPQDEDKKGDAILELLKTGPYGRCVYHSDNDVADHQVVAMQFEGGITAGFNMEAFTNYHGRRTRIMGSMGCLVGDEDLLTIADFSTDKVTEWLTKEHSTASGHGGGDWGLMRDFLRAVDAHDEALLTSTLEASMDSHRMGFAAEESRLGLKTIAL
ncbi:MAG: Gfo/Idh/MocA family oxidoreductase [Saprospiraceae bacterium]|nr:Gfo/Idh/MocA family oxidoreductase [Saprospiraceae bacterium]